MKTTITTAKLFGFAEACYDHNSIEELQDALKLRKADVTDCDIWQITPSQWRAAIEEALAAKRLDAQSPKLPIRRIPGHQTPRGRRGK